MKYAVSKEVGLLVAEGTYRILASISHPDPLAPWKSLDTEMKDTFAQIVKDVIEGGMSNEELLDLWVGRGVTLPWDASEEAREMEMRNEARRIPQQPPAPLADKTGDKVDDEKEPGKEDEKDAPELTDAELSDDEDDGPYDPDASRRSNRSQRALGLTKILVETVKANFRCATGANI